MFNKEAIESLEYKLRKIEEVLDIKYKRSYNVIYSDIYDYLGIASGNKIEVLEKKIKTLEESLEQFKDCHKCGVVVRKSKATKDAMLDHFGDPVTIYFCSRCKK